MVAFGVQKPRPVAKNHYFFSSLFVGRLNSPRSIGVTVKRVNAYFVAFEKGLDNQACYI